MAKRQPGKTLSVRGNDQGECNLTHLTNDNCINDNCWVCVFFVRTIKWKLVSEMSPVTRLSIYKFSCISHTDI